MPRAMQMAVRVRKKTSAGSWGGMKARSRLAMPRAMQMAGMVFSTVSAGSWGGMKARSRLAMPRAWADGGDGNDDGVGGLVGVNDSGTITACYATGMADGGDGDGDSVGGARGG